MESYFVYKYIVPLSDYSGIETISVFSLRKKLYATRVSHTGYNLPWEDEGLEYPVNFARPSDIAIEASNGASDYGNKFGEPVLTGFSRSFGQMMPNGERREYIKPIMFSGGLGQLDHIFINKEVPQPGKFITF